MFLVITESTSETFLDFQETYKILFQKNNFII